MSGTVDSAGTLNAGFAQSGQNGATISGQMTSTGGGGNWEDVFACVGTWTAEKR